MPYLSRDSALFIASAKLLPDWTTAAACYMVLLNVTCTVSQKKHPQQF